MSKTSTRQKNIACSCLKCSVTISFVVGENNIYSNAADAARARSILVIDDDYAIRETLVELFEGEGYRVHCAENGEEGLSLLARIELPSVVLLDQNMPVMNGSEFLRRKALEASLERLPVVLMSAERPRHDGSGIVQFLPKPFNVADLLDTVERFASAGAGALAHS